MIRFAPLLLLPLLAACETPETARASGADEGQVNCRSQAVEATGLPFGETIATPVRTNVMGEAAIQINAGEAVYRCNVDAAGVVIGFRRIA